MDFGHLHSVQNVDFTLAPDSEWSATRLKQLSKSRALAPNQHPLFVGAPVWNTPEWADSSPVIYPRGTPQKSFLHHYSRHFSTIELNTSFYRIPSPEVVDRWAQETPEGFKFCPKLFQGISHQPEPNWPDLTREFAERCRALGTRLGLPFLQLAPSFSPESTADKVWLKAFSKVWPRDLPLAIELRHPAWFSKNEIIVGAREFIADQGWSTVITDTAGRRDASHTTLTTDRVMIRLLANSPARLKPELHPSDLLRVNAWAERLKTWVDLGIREIYFCIHQPDNILVPELAEKFRTKIGALESRPLCKPSEAGQLGLFA